MTFLLVCFAFWVTQALRSSYGHLINTQLLEKRNYWPIFGNIEKTLGILYWTFF